MELTKSLEVIAERAARGEPLVQDGDFVDCSGRGIVGRGFYSEIDAPGILIQMNPTFSSNGPHNYSWGYQASNGGSGFYTRSETRRLILRNPQEFVAVGEWVKRRIGSDGTNS